MAGFVLLGARVGAKIGPRRALHIGMVGPTVAAITISLTNQGWMLFAVQAFSGAHDGARSARHDRGDRQQLSRQAAGAGDRLPRLGDPVGAGRVTPHRRGARLVGRVALVVRRAVRDRGRQPRAHRSPGPDRSAPRGGDRLGRGGPVIDRHHLDLDGVQLPQCLGVLPGVRSGALRHRRSVARAVPADHRCRAGAGVLPLDPTADGRRRARAVLARRDPVEQRAVDRGVHGADAVHRYRRPASSSRCTCRSYRGSAASRPRSRSCRTRCRSSSRTRRCRGCTTGAARAPSLGSRSSSCSSP